MSRQQRARSVPVQPYQPTPQETTLAGRLNDLALAGISGAVGTRVMPAATEFGGWMATPQLALFRPTRPARGIGVRKQTRAAAGIRPLTKARRAMTLNDLGQ